MFGGQRTEEDGRSAARVTWHGVGIKRAKSIRWRPEQE
jgi:hypothetical protein